MISRRNEASLLKILRQDEKSEIKIQTLENLIGVSAVSQKNSVSLKKRVPINR